MQLGQHIGLLVPIGRTVVKSISLVSFQVHSLSSFQVAVCDHSADLSTSEGVNEQTENQITAHTGNVCTLNKLVDFTADLVGTTCQSSDGSNAGCAYLTGNNNTYGHGFNLIAGGVYAHTWQEDAIQVWFFPRTAIPSDITNGNPNPDSWGTPAAIFSNNNMCNIASSFYDHSIIFDITLCGDWAGAVYSSDGCPGTCAQQVADPDNFKREFVSLQFTFSSAKIVHCSCQVQDCVP